MGGGDEKVPEKSHSLLVGLRVEEGGQTTNLNCSRGRYQVSSEETHTHTDRKKWVKTETQGK